MKSSEEVNRMLNEMDLKYDAIYNQDVIKGMSLALEWVMEFDISNPICKHFENKDTNTEKQKR